jgi:hypothetical protein
MAMKRIAILSTGAALVLAGGIAGTALASGSSHTLHLTTARLQFVNTSSTTFVEADSVSKSAKKVGYESITCNDGGHQIACSLTIALKGGVLLGHLTIPISSSATTSVTGKVTGGLGDYRGDTGTVKGTITGKHGTLTVKYHS